jgi:hypothetical protein
VSYKLIFDDKFHGILFKIDQELAQEAEDSDCPYCDHQLHHADYPRSPNGIPANQRHHYESRFSFCCSKCRKRITPETVRFFGRRWYPAAAFLLVCILQLGITDKRIEQIKRHLGIRVNKLTWERWRLWWQDAFELTLFWKQAKGNLATQPVSSFLIARSILRIFSGSLSIKLVRLLQFLSPLTGKIYRGISG